MAEILAFAEIEGFADTPTRFYSSGMRARLGFAIATDLDPDLLLIDEVLGVGDSAFQRKCARRIDALKERGTTLILVSHSDQAVRSVCERALWLHEGRVALDGPVDEVAAAYAKSQEGC